MKHRIAQLAIEGEVPAGVITQHFGGPAMDADWFHRQVAAAVAQAGDRYTRELHFELPLATHFEALGRTPVFTAMLDDIGSKIKKALNSLEIYPLKTDVAQTSEMLRQTLQSVCDALDKITLDLSKALDFSPLRKTAQAARDAVGEAIRQLWTSRRERASQFESEHGRAPAYYELPDEGLRSHTLDEIDSRLGTALVFCGSANAHLAELPAMLLVGNAGSGKTHLACSVAEKCLGGGLPAILLLGEQFEDSEPWTQVLHLLGLSCNRDEFLGALDAAGEAAGCRALIIIDALNEGAGIRFWRRHLPSFLANIRYYRHLGIALTVRQEYAESGVFPADALIRVEHHGFAGKIDSASRHFFQHYGLAEPNIPLFSPGFDNPLFLKLVCGAISDSPAVEVPADLIGVTSLFRFLLDRINVKLADVLDYDPEDRRVQNELRRLAELMAENSSESLPIEEAKRVLDSIHPNTCYSQSLLRHLIAENLVLRTRKPGSAGANEEVVRFTHQRLSDHLIVQSLLARTPKKELRRVFGRNGSWGQQMNFEWWPLRIAGWIGALAVQLPESHGLEIDQILPCSLDEEVVRHAFIASIVWRQPTAFSAATKKRIEDLLARQDDSAEELLAAAVSVTARPDHPYNADWLDSLLFPLLMADRDLFWSKFLFGKMNEENSVKRLIDWAVAERTESRFSDEVARLASMTLAWFLTTSDRFVRDRACKAIVALLEDRIPVLRWLLHHFSGVAEPYVEERLYAAAYGCAMRTQQILELRQLAQEVYDRVFRSGSPTPSVLLRDHARGVVEAAVGRGLRLDFEPARLVPPFRSTWPKAPPSLARLKTCFEGKDKYETDSALFRIFVSVTDDDFTHYVIGDVWMWSSRRKGKSPPSPKEIFQGLLKSMPEEAENLEFYAKQCLKLSNSHSSANDDECRSQREFIKVFESRFARQVGRGLGRQFLQQVAPCLKEPPYERYQRNFSLELFQRLILRRVLELGWTTSRFGEFDRHVRSKGREAHKAERIGKKYQWIAYDEFHARICDNFGPSEDGASLIESTDWERGTWSARFRDLDPSLLVSNTPHDDWGSNHQNWWTPCSYDGWTAFPTPIDWLKATADLPPPTNFLELEGPNKEQWMMLHSHAHWKKQECPGTFNGTEGDSREIHYIFRSYLIRRSHLAALMAWGRCQNWLNDRLPSPWRGTIEHLHEYLHERFWSPHFDEPIEDDWIKSRSFPNDMPHPVVETTGQYLSEYSTYDCSIESTVMISLPSRWLTRKMGLRLSGRRGEFVDKHGRLTAFDPSTREVGRSALVISREAFRVFLAREGLALFRTILGEKNIYPPQHVTAWLGRLTILGIYSWEGAQIQGDFRTEVATGRS